MKAAVFKEINCISIEKRPIPAIQNPNEVLLSIIQCGICGSDTRGLTGEMIYKKDVIIGHEFVAKVKDIGSSVDNVNIGDQVVVHPNYECGQCYYCWTGKENICPNINHLGNSIDGGIAEYCVVPKEKVFKISSNVPPEEAIFVEPLACALNGTTKACAHPGDSVLILGGGPMALLYFLILHKTGIDKIFISEISKERRDFAKNIGAKNLINPKNDDLGKIIMDETGIGADIVIDTVGILLETAIKMVRRDGLILSFGINESAKPPISQSIITMSEISIKGVYCAHKCFPLAIDLLEQGAIPVRNLLTHSFPLEDTQKALSFMAQGKGIKSCVVIRGPLPV